MKMVCVTGIDGSGKSTLVAGLARVFPDAKVVTIWDSLRNPELAPHIGFKSKESIDRYLFSLRYPARTLFLFHCLAQALAEAREENPRLVIVDGYWFKYGASEAAMGGRVAEIEAMAKVFPEPDLIFHLEIDSALAAARKGAVSGYEAGYDPSKSPEAFARFQGRSQEFMLAWTRARGAVVLDGAAPVEEKLERMRTEVEWILG